MGYHIHYGISHPADSLPVRQAGAGGMTQKNNVKEIMQIDILTLFPKMFVGPFCESILARAQKKGLVSIKIHNLRQWAKDKHKSVDDKPFGGGVGMVLRCQPIFDAVKDCKHQSQNLKLKAQSRNAGCKKPYVILLSPQGKVLTHEKSQELAKKSHLILICGHYEGVDERVSENLVDEEISIGDYILTGGELPATVLTESVVRLIPGVLEKNDATRLESFSLTNKQGKRLLEAPQYTRPADYCGMRVPAILLSGNHQEIDKWKQAQAEKVTKDKRPEFMASDSSE